MLDPKHPLAELLRRDRRYRFEAYVFVFDALRFGQEKMGLGHGEEEEQEERHVTGQELCRAIQRYAIDQYGLLAQPVLEHWGVRSTGDFGQMRKTDHDRREDFNDVFRFEDAFGEEVVFSTEHCRTEGESEE
jgi:uncharacterized repeat protein (TIGR04138 family)